jgi:hypothetical protein
MSVIGQQLWRRRLVWALIAHQLVVGTGATLACPLSAAGAAESFPCQTCGCGCRSAEQCWRQCCCFTNREKVAWARRHRVVVPAAAMAAADQEAAVAQAAPCTHCGRGATSPAATSQRTGPPGGREEGAAGDGHRPGGVCWLSVLRCHRLGAYGQLAEVSWTGQEPPGLLMILLPLGHIEPGPFLTPPFSRPAPPTPPPEAGLSRRTHCQS